ncbi:phosphoribosylglycinamide formyltransferase [Desulfosarcina sp. OttesenSCG-928-A07]|nr:phosphoribosylglycinamide formyltransferase [Desulfosarcina sp. OttesenSCG-928-G17]MDL2328451.1 phosphoribosylglycinamide formyltransferase [Desulfosarcina sp. OttesenSCG-928-A07]
MKPTLRIGALISGGGTNLQAIIDACENNRINGKVVFVGADTAAAKGLARAARHKIPAFVVPYSDIIQSYRKAPDAFPLPDDANLTDLYARQRLFPPNTPMDRLRSFFCTRAAAESRLLAEMAAYGPVDLLVLAGFMRNFTPYFIDRFSPDPAHPRIMNIHPAILPAFPGVDGYGDTFRYGCKVGGCTVHFVDEGEDSGPIIGQRTFPILETDTLEDVKQKGLQAEWQLYPECIQLFAENRLAVVKMTHALENGSIQQRRVVKISSGLV